MSETKQKVFDALLSEYGTALKYWRERYEKAERFGRSHDVEDLYEKEEDIRPDCTSLGREYAHKKYDESMKTQEAKLEE